MSDTPSEPKPQAKDNKGAQKGQNKKGGEGAKKGDTKKKAPVPLPAFIEERQKLWDSVKQQHEEELKS